MHLSIALCFVASAAMGVPQEEKPRKPKGLAGVGLTAEQVNRAIDRGADFLIKAVKTRKYRALEIFLIGLALAHADALDRDKEVHNLVLAKLRTADPNRLGTYNVAVVAMLLDHLGTHKQLLADFAKFLVEAQGKGGTWHYGAKIVPQIQRKRKRSLVTVAGGVPLDEPGKPWVQLKKENGPDHRSRICRPCRATKR